MPAKRKPRVDRLLSMSEVADLMKLPPGTPRVRAQKVRRMLRRIERRDGQTYMKQVGRKWYVSIAAVEQLAPWDPATLHQLRTDLEELQHQVHVQTRRINTLASFVREQRKFNKKLAGAIKKRGRV